MITVASFPSTSQFCVADCQKGVEIGLRNALTIPSLVERIKLRFDRKGGIGQHDPFHVFWMRTRVHQHLHATERVANENVGWLGLRGREQRVQVLDVIRRRVLTGLPVAESDVHSVIDARRDVGKCRQRSGPITGLAADAVREDDRRTVSGRASEVETPAVDLHQLVDARAS